MTMSIVKKLGDTPTLTLQALDARDNEALLFGVPTWTTSDPVIGTLAVAPDGRSAVFTASGLGVVQIGARAFADQAQTRALEATLDIQVEPGEAVRLVILVG
jgi:hypothetical protein